ncbi:hypothetical protein D4R78_02315 [bacterium]|nr:MAG: hypothetical protein D4R78_02315 [bacterium]
MLKILILSFSIVLLLLPVGIFAQQPVAPTKQSNSGENDKAQQQIRDVLQRIKQQQEKELESLKQTNPKLYQEKKDALERQKQISAIATSFRQGKLSMTKTKNQLLPLLKQDLQDFINRLDSQIKILESRIEELKKTKSNPDSLLQERLNQLLGQSKT